MSITTRVLGGFSIPVLVLGVVAVFSAWSAFQVYATSREVNQTLEALEALEGVAASFNLLESEERSYVLTAQPEHLQAYREAETSANQSVKRLKSLVSSGRNPGIQEVAGELESLITQRMALARHKIELRDREGFQAALTLVKAGSGMRMGEQVRTRIRETADGEQKVLKLRQESAATAANFATATVLYGAFAAFAFVCVAGVLISRHITAPVRRLAVAAETIGAGALDHRVSIKSNDELGALAKAFNGMAIQVQAAQEELKQRTIVLQSVLNSMSEGVIVADTSGKFLLFNPAAEQILRKGATNEESSKWTETYDVFLPDKVTPYPADDLPLVRAIRGEPADNIEMFVGAGHPEGTWLTVTGRPVKGEDGILHGGVAVFTDVTRRKRAEQAFTAERNLLRTLIDRLPEHIFVKDRQSRYLLANTALMGLQKVSTQEELVGRSDFDFYPKEVAEQYRASDEVVFSTGEPLIEREEIAFDPSGARRWLSTTKVPLHDSDGNLVGLVGISHDVTGRKQTEDRIRSLNEDLTRRAAELESVNKELEAFSYSVSHDLRSPLRHIDGFAELLVKRSGPVLDQQSLRYANTIAQSAKELGQLIDDLLVFSRMGRSEMRYQPLSLNDVAHGAISSLNGELKDRNITWQIGTLPRVKGDSAMLRLVFVNLLSNAVKYTRTRDHAAIEVGVCNGHPGQVVVYVKDNGVGFDMRYVQKLFGVFQRLHSTREFEGTGIGLANVRRIIHRHGGETWADGVVDGGATFYFSLPESMETANG